MNTATSAFLSGAKLKSLLTGSFLGVSGVAIPASAFALNENVRTKIQNSLEPVSTAFKQIPSLLPSDLTSGGNSIYENWKESAKTLSEKFQAEQLKSSLEAFNQIETAAPQVKEVVTTENLKEANYIMFKFGSIFWSLLKHLPLITADSIKEETDANRGATSLDLQKIISMVKDEKFLPMAQNLSKLNMDGLDSKNADAIMEIIKSVDENKVQSFLNKVTKNIKKIETSDKDTTQEILKKAIIGTEEMKKISSQLTNLKNQVSEQKESLKNIPGLEESQITKLENVIKTLTEAFQKN